MKALTLRLGRGSVVYRGDVQRAWPEMLEETQEGIGYGSQAKRLFPVEEVGNGVESW